MKSTPLVETLSTPHEHVTSAIRKLRQKRAAGDPVFGMRVTLESANSAKMAALTPHCHIVGRIDELNAPSPSAHVADSLMRTPVQIAGRVFRDEMVEVLLAIDDIMVAVFWLEHDQFSDERAAVTIESGQRRERRPADPSGESRVKEQADG